MARKKAEALELDDIELLNIHNYPESYPRSVVNQVRNDKGAQRRLEELLRDLPNRGRRRRNENPPKEESADQGQGTRA
ncbi:MAG: hypothetical protein KDK37_08385 [Leptospiraceae bacterium]|nr:hypothetical protein [Leptospiraceae bacterium]